MDYIQRTNENQDRTDENRYYGKECYVHGDEFKLDHTIDLWKKSVTAFSIEKYKHYFSGNLCDVGCGVGVLPLMLLESGVVINITGIDYFNKSIDLARKIAIYMKLDNRADFKCMNFVDAINLQVESFDSVMSFHTLEHIYKSDHNRFVDNIYKILKPGGLAIISVPYDHEYGSNEHVSFFVENSLVELFERHAFKTVEIEHLEKLNFLTGIFRK